MKIGNMTLETRRPDDLDAQLVASTGCTSAEIEMLLAAGPDRVARAVLPFVTGELPMIGALATEIAGDPTAIETVRALYATPATPGEVEA